MIPMAITKLVTASLDVGLGPIVVLEEVDGNRWFPIFVGHCEAAAIDRKVMGEPAPRPLTHDLIVNLIEAINGTLEEVVVNELRDNTFFAQLRIRQEDGVVREVDCRPSDAIAVAVRTNARILVDPDVLDRAAE